MCTDGAPPEICVAAGVLPTSSCSLSACRAAAGRRCAAAHCSRCHTPARLEQLLLLLGTTNRPCPALVAIAVILGVHITLLLPGRCVLQCSTCRLVACWATTPSVHYRPASLGFVAPHVAATVSCGPAAATKCCAPVGFACHGDEALCLLLPPSYQRDASPIVWRHVRPFGAGPFGGNQGEPQAPSPPHLSPLMYLALLQPNQPAVTPGHLPARSERAAQCGAAAHALRLGALGTHSRSHFTLQPTCHVCMQAANPKQQPTTAA